MTVQELQIQKLEQGLREARKLLMERGEESCVYFNPDQCELFPYTACHPCRIKWLLFATRYVERENP